MSTNNLTVRVDAETKKAFDDYCEKAGLNAATVVNMFINTVVRERVIPFAIEDKKDECERERTALRARFKKTIDSIQDDAIKHGIATMAFYDINTEIDAARREMRGQ